MVSYIFHSDSYLKYQIVIEENKLIMDHQMIHHVLIGFDGI